MSADPGSATPSRPPFLYPFGFDLTPKRVDAFLFHRVLWRRAAETMEPRLGAAFDLSGVLGQQGSSKTESCACDRAVIFLVLDLLDRAVASVPDPWARRVMSSKYEAGLTHERICRRHGITPGRLRGLLDYGRGWVAGQLRSLPGDALKDFTQATRTILPRLDRHRITPGQYAALAGRTTLPADPRTTKREPKDSRKATKR